MSKPVKVIIVPAGRGDLADLASVRTHVIEKPYPQYLPFYPFEICMAKDHHWRCQEITLNERYMIVVMIINCLFDYAKENKVTNTLMSIIDPKNDYYGVVALTLINLDTGLAEDFDELKFRVFFNYRRGLLRGSKYRLDEDDPAVNQARDIMLPTKQKAKHKAAKQKYTPSIPIDIPKVKKARNDEEMFTPPSPMNFINNEELM